MLIGFTGYSDAGKDVAATVFRDAGFTDFKLSAPFKDMLRALYRACGVDEVTIERKIEGDLKEEFCPILQQTPRYAQQTLGSDWRDQMHPDLWITPWRHKTRMVLEHGSGKAICSDIRRHSEHRALRDLGGVLVRISRPGFEAKGHRAELEISELKEDYHLTNTGSVLDLQNKARKLLKELGQ